MSNDLIDAALYPAQGREDDQEGVIGDGQGVWDMENHLTAERLFPGVEGDVGKGGFKSHSPTLPQPGPAGGLGRC